MVVGAETPRCMTYAMLWNSEKEGARVDSSTEGEARTLHEDVAGITSQSQIVWKREIYASTAQIHYTL